MPAARSAFDVVTGFIYYIWHGFPKAVELHAAYLVSITLDVFDMMAGCKVTLIFTKRYGPNIPTQIDVTIL